MPRTPSAPPVPFSQEELLTIRLGQASFPFFLTHIYSQSFKETFLQSNGTSLPFSLGSIHYQWARLLEIYNRLCFLAPRLHLKSTVVHQGYSFWKLFRGEADVSGMSISYKDQLAAEHTEKIKTAILKNTYCRFWRDRKPTSDSIVDFEIKFGPNEEIRRGTIDPYGVMGNMRGLHPDWVCCDDILGDLRNRLDSKQLTFIDDVFTGVITHLPRNNGPIVVIGTPQSYEDTLFRLSQNPRYVWGRFPAEWKDPATGERRSLWPQVFNLPRLQEIREESGERAYQVEFLLQPILAVDTFFPRWAIERLVDPTMRPADPTKPYVFSEMVRGTYGGFDVGKQVHPTHISIGAKIASGDIIQIYQQFVEGMRYDQQAMLINSLIENFKINRLYYDGTKGEMDDRSMSRKALGVKLSRPQKVQMALAMENRIFAAPGSPGLILLPDERQVGQIVSVNKFMQPIASSQGHGDCYDPATEVLTDSGWKFWPEVTEGDLLGCAVEGGLEFHTPDRLIAEHYQGPMYHVQSLQVDLCVTPRHRLYTAQSAHAPFTVAFPHQLEGTSHYYRRALARPWEGVEQDTVKVLDQDIPTPLWMEFLGYFIAEGNTSYHYTADGRVKNGHVLISQSKQATVDLMEQCLSKLPWPHKTVDRRAQGRTVEFFFYKKQLALYLDNVLGKGSTRIHIPRDVLALSQTNLRVLYTALMAGDGGYSNANVHYYTSSKLLADQMQELVIKLGMTANVETHDDRGRPAPHGVCRALRYVVTVQQRPVTVVNREKKQDGWSDYDGMIYCASVPGGLLWVRRNGKPVISGNSFFSVGLMCRAADDGPVMQSLGDANAFFGGYGQRPNPLASAAGR